MDALMRCLCVPTREHVVEFFLLLTKLDLNLGDVGFDLLELLLPTCLRRSRMTGDSSSCSTGRAAASARRISGSTPLVCVLHM